MNTRSGIEAKARFVAALITAIAGSVHAEAAEEPGAEEREAAGIEAVKRAGREAREIRQQREGSQP